MKRTALARRAPLARTDGLIRSTGVRKASKRNPTVVELDTLCRDIVMTRHGAFLIVEGKRRSWVGTCAWCQQPGKSLQASHVEPKGRAPHMRHDPRNVVPLCAGCHLFRWHKSPVEAAQWIVSYLGQDAVDMLRLRARAASGKPSLALVRLALQADARAVGLV